MFHLVYASTATAQLTGPDLLELLQQARDKNTRLGITGLLLYKRGTFMQALEGDESVVRAVYTAICRDERHHHVSTLLAVPATARLFPHWSMGFRSIGEGSLGGVPGYDPDPQVPFPGDDPPWKQSVAMRLLAGFLREG